MASSSDSDGWSGRVVPGLILLIPRIERMVKVDLRVITLDVPAQEAITRDNVTVKVNAVAYFQVVDPSRAIVSVVDYRRATSLMCQTTLRSILGQSDLDTLLSSRDQINQQLQLLIDEQTEAWGIKVTSVEVRDVELPESMQRAMARQAEAEREKRAKIIHAEGEFAASEQLAEAARIINSEEAGLQLRYLQTLTQIANDRRSTIVFPLPIDVTRGLLSNESWVGNSGGSARAADRPTPRPAPAPDLADDSRPTQHGQQRVEGTDDRPTERFPTP